MNFVKRITVTMLIFILMCGMVYGDVEKWYQTKGNSMYPTLTDGQYFSVSSKVAYNEDDIVVLNNAQFENPLVKRIKGDKLIGDNDLHSVTLDKSESDIIGSVDKILEASDDIFIDAADIAKALDPLDPSLAITITTNISSISSVFKINNKYLILGKNKSSQYCLFELLLSNNTVVTRYNFSSSVSGDVSYVSNPEQVGSKYKFWVECCYSSENKSSWRFQYRNSVAIVSTTNFTSFTKDATGLFSHNKKIYSVSYSKSGGYYFAVVIKGSSDPDEEYYCSYYNCNTGDTRDSSRLLHWFDIDRVEVYRSTNFSSWSRVWREDSFMFTNGGYYGTVRMSFSVSDPVKNRFLLAVTKVTQYREMDQYSYYYTEEVKYEETMFYSVNNGVTYDEMIFYFDQYKDGYDKCDRPNPMPSWERYGDKVTQLSRFSDTVSISKIETTYTLYDDYGRPKPTVMEREYYFYMNGWCIGVDGEDYDEYDKKWYPWYGVSVYKQKRFADLTTLYYDDYKSKNTWYSLYSLYTDSEILYVGDYSGRSFYKSSDGSTIYLRIKRSNNTYQYYRIKDSKATSISESVYNNNMPPSEPTIPSDPVPPNIVTPDSLYNDLGYSKYYVDHEIAIFYNSSDRKIKIPVSNQIPTLSLTSPSSNTVRSGHSGFNTLTITGKVKDNDVGDVLKIYYRINGSSGQSGTKIGSNITANGKDQSFTDSINISSVAQGTHTLYVWAEDSSGGRSAEVSTKFIMDKTAPSITIKTNGNTNVAKKHSTVVTVTDANGLTSCQYQWTQSTTFPTGGTWTTFSSGATITRDKGDGNFYLHIKAKDTVGNESSTTSSRFLLDNTPPITPTLVSSNTAWTNQDVSVAITYSSDSVVRQYKIGSGGNWIDYEIPVVLSSNVTVFARGHDLAGNISAEGTLEVDNIDKLVPTLSFTQSPSASVWTNDNVVISIFGHDTGGSGVKQIRLPDNTWHIGNSASFTVNSNGTYVFLVEDNAGNISSNIEYKISNIDMIAPAINMSPSGNSKYEQHHSPIVTVTDAGGSNLKGNFRWIWSMDYMFPDSLDDFNISTSNNCNITSPDGVTGDYYLHIYSEDNAGNISKFTSNIFKLDNETPILDARDELEASYLSGKHFVDLIIEDRHAGILNIEYGFKPGDYIKTFNISGDKYASIRVLFDRDDGSLLYVRSTDMVNNVSVEKEYTLIVNSPPEAKIISVDDKNVSGLSEHVVTVGDQDKLRVKIEATDLDKEQLTYVLSIEKGDQRFVYDSGSMMDPIKEREIFLDIPNDFQSGTYILKLTVKDKELTASDSIDLIVLNISEMVDYNLSNQTYAQNKVKVTSVLDPLHPYYWKVDMGLVEINISSDNNVFVKDSSTRISSNLMTLIDLLRSKDSSWLGVYGFHKSGNNLIVPVMVEFLDNRGSNVYDGNKKLVFNITVDPSGKCIVSDVVNEGLKLSDVPEDINMKYSIGNFKGLNFMLDVKGPTILTGLIRNNGRYTSNIPMLGVCARDRGMDIVPSDRMSIKLINKLSGEELNDSNIPSILSNTGVYVLDIKAEDKIGNESYLPGGEYTFSLVNNMIVDAISKKNTLEYMEHVTPIVNGETAISIGNGYVAFMKSARILKLPESDRITSMTFSGLKYLYIVNGNNVYKFDISVLHKSDGADIIDFSYDGVEDSESAILTEFNTYSPIKIVSRMDYHLVLGGSSLYYLHNNSVSLVGNSYVDIDKLSSSLAIRDKEVGKVNIESLQFKPISLMNLLENDLHNPKRIISKGSEIYVIDNGNLKLYLNKKF